MPIEEGKYLIYIKEPRLGSYSENLTIYINPRSYWEEKGSQIDSFTDEQWVELEPILEEIGLTQVNDCVFECGIFISSDELREVLLGEGFTEETAFNEYMVDNTASEEDDAVYEDCGDMFDSEDY